jgi:hypothetical protein
MGALERPLCVKQKEKIGSVTKVLTQKEKNTQEFLLSVPVET